MRKLNPTIISVVFLFISISVKGQVPFKKGVNITNWFQEGSATEIQFSKYTKEDIYNIKSLGCDVVRLPINLHAMTSGTQDYIIDPLFFNFLDEVVDWFKEANMHLILDNHTFDPSVNTDPSVEIPLIKVWTQMADHYKDNYENIYYEILNEPHGIADEVWGQIQQRVINAIRAVDKNHTIIVGPANWNSYSSLENLPEYSDNNLIYTFHFYDPFIFTHQGAGWTNPSMEPLAGVPFPYDADKMPECPAELKDTWIEKALSSYSAEGNLDHVKKLIDIAVDFKNTRNVPVFCGEFGVYMNNSNNSDRVYWYQEVRKYFDEKEIPWTIWDYKGGFGIHEKNSNGFFEYDLNIPLIEALGFTAPDQKEFVSKPDSTGFILYDDYIGKNIEVSNHGSHQINYYDPSKPNNGDYCLFWSEADQYNKIGFDFKPDKDLTELVKQDYAIDFFVRGSVSGPKFDIRFTDTDTNDPDDHPWRMRFTIDETIVDWNMKWHHLHIPLKKFTEQGAWDNGWFNPEGKFDWSAVDQFEIVAEHHDLKGKEFWFDNIILTNKDTARIHEQGVLTSFDNPIKDPYNNISVFPNPVHHSANIQFLIDNPGFADIKIFDLMGNEILTLFEGHKPAGQHTISWNCKDKTGALIPDGLYFIRLETAENIEGLKIMLRQS